MNCRTLFPVEQVLPPSSSPVIVERLVQLAEHARDALRERRFHDLQLVCREAALVDKTTITGDTEWPLELWARLAGLHCAFVIAQAHRTRHGRSAMTMDCCGAWIIRGVQKHHSFCPVWLPATEGLQ